MSFNSRHKLYELRNLINIVNPSCTSFLNQSIPLEAGIHVARGVLIPRAEDSLENYQGNILAFLTGFTSWN